MAYLYARLPASAPPLSIKVEATEERLVRGRYLFEKVLDCDGCHSQRDFTRFGGPVIAGGRGAGWVFPPEMGLPGTVAASNITPDKETGIGNWTDGEKIRAIREGIGRDGRALFPMMPYQYFRHLGDEDVQALVAYMNGLPPIRIVQPRTQLNFPVNLLIKSAPQPAGSVPPPDRGERLKYGEYLFRIAACGECHTPMEKGEPAMERYLAGGRRFTIGNATAVSANITPDPETGIGRWAEQQFLEKFYQYREYAEQGSPKVGPEGFTLMPWLAYSQWPPEDLGAVFVYLKTQKPIHSPVETHPATL
ncbi:MAG: c-type cytochrome [Bryobacteraceae bacterium]